MSTKPEDGRDRLERRVARLTGAVVGLTLLWVGMVAWMMLRHPEIPSVVSVERLEIREPDGELAFVLANSARPAVATMDGEILMADQAEERRHPTFIFFDGRGDEVGGIAFQTRETPDGTSVARFLAFDGYKQDETVQLGHRQGPDGAFSGLRIEDRPLDLSLVEFVTEIGLEPGFTRAELEAAIEAIPEEEREARLREFMGTRRVQLGSTQESAALILHDGEGRPRIAIEVPADDQPSIRVLDAGGETVLRLPN